MAWENANKIFPSGVVQTPDGVITTQQLKDSGLKMIQYQSTKNARNMVIETKRYIWGDNGEFAIGTDYDLLNARPHVTNENPTNVFGMAMINNFYKLNNLAQLLEPPLGRENNFNNNCSNW